MTRDELVEFIREHKLAVLASASGEGNAQAALVGIAVTDQLELIFDTVKNTRKYPNLKRDPRCAFVIGQEGEITVQYEGIAEELEGAALDRYRPLYFKAWPGGPARLNWPGIVYFVVRPRWIRIADYGETPPHIEVLRFDGL